jgi:hypothetical protein
LAIGIAGCRRPDPRDFRTVDLTVAEFADLYRVNTEGSTTAKHEWDLGVERRVFAVLERSDDGGRTWRVEQRSAFQLTATTARLIYRLDRGQQPISSSSPQRLTLEVRIGGNTGTTSGWSGNYWSLELPAGSLTLRTQRNDPENILIVESSGRAYRLRLELAAP